MSKDDNSLRRIWSRAAGSSLLTDSVSATVYAAVGKGAGFFIPFFIAAWFGVSPEMDAFFFAYAIIFFFATTFSAVVESIIVPFIAEAHARGEDVGLFVGRVLTLSAVGIGALTVVLLLAVKPVVSAITSFSAEGVDLIMVILLETSPLAVLLVWTSVLSGSFNAFRRYAPPALSPAVRAAVTLAFIFAFKDSLGVHSIAWGYVAGEAARLVVLLALIRKLRDLRLTLPFSWDRKFVEFMKVASYQVAGMSLAVLSPLIDRVMASWLSPKSVSMLEYSEKLFFIPSNLLTMGFLTVLLSDWSAAHYAGGDSRRGLSRTLRTVTPFLLAFTLVFFLAGGFITETVYGLSISGEDLGVMKTMFGYFVLGLPAIVIGNMFARWILVIKKTGVLLKISVFKVLVNVVLNLLFISHIGLSGIALSSTVTACLTMAACYYYFRVLNTGGAGELQGKAV